MNRGCTGSRARPAHPVTLLRWNTRAGRHPSVSAHAPIEPMKQRRRPQPLFQQAHVAADRAVGDTEFGRCILEAGVAGGRLERADGIERGQRSAMLRHMPASNLLT